jgi:hypothetical protein
VTAPGRVRAARDHDLVVVVRCDRCRRKLGWLYGTPEFIQAFRTVDGLQGGMSRVARIDYFTQLRKHPCREQPEVRFDRLEAAYRMVAARPEPRDRVIWLPSSIASLPRETG